MTRQSLNAATSARIHSLATVGSTLLVAGVWSAYTNWTSALARYMYIEDLMNADDAHRLGLTADAVDTVMRMTPADKLWAVTSGVMALLGLAAIIAAIAQYRTARRRMPLGFMVVPAIPGLGPNAAIVEPQCRGAG